MTMGTLGRPILLGPATRVTDTLVFAAAPDTQVLSETAHGERKLDAVITAGTARYYEGKDYILDRDSDGNIVSLTTLVDGALDAGGSVDATYTAITFDSDDTSEEHRVTGFGFRVTIDGAREGTGAATVQVMGRTFKNVDYNNMGNSFTVAAGESRTIYFDETTDLIAVDLSAVAGEVDLYIQDVS